MRLTGESARAKELFEEGEFILAKTDLTMAATPKQLYDRWQRAVKKGYKQKINIDEYWEGLIIGTAIDLKERIKKTSSICSEKAAGKGRTEGSTCQNARGSQTGEGN